LTADRLTMTGERSTKQGRGEGNAVETNARRGILGERVAKEKHQERRKEGSRSRVAKGVMGVELRREKVKKGI